jgi:hypothetical protein
VHEDLSTVWEHNIVKVTKLLKEKEPILQKIVFELRYRRGFSYLDKCGRTINAIMDDYPEWTTDPGNPNPQAASLISLANSCVLSIGTKKLDLSLEIPVGGEPLGPDEVDMFSAQVDQTTGIVTDQLGLNEFGRIGCRLWYIFPCENQEDSERWLSSLQCYSVTPKLVEAFGGVKEAVGVAIVITGGDRAYRIAFNGVQRTATVDLGAGILNVRVRDLSSDQQRMLREQEKAKASVRRAPEFPAMIDIDAYVENPESPDTRSFVTSTHAEALDRLRTAVEGV